MRSPRTLTARAALIAAVPASAAAAATLANVHVLADADHATALGVCITALALVAIAAALGPIALRDASRMRAVATVLATAATLVIGGTAWLIVVFLHLCTSSAAPGLAALGVGAAVYIPGSMVALRDTGRATWAWPLVIVLALGVSLAVLALLTGGPHYCET